MPAAEPSAPTRQTGGAWLLVLGLGLIGLSLAWRALSRQDHYVGWEAIGAAYGQHLLATLPTGEALAKAWVDTRHFQYWNGANSGVQALLAGALTLLWPWEFWAQTISVLTGALVLYLLGLAAGVSGSAWGVLLIAAAGSGTLLSHTVLGAPYVSGLLPHALALWLVRSPACQSRPWRTLAIGLVAVEFSWHAYPLGKTHFAVFLAAAFLLRGVRPATRLAWLACAALQMYQLRTFEGSAGSFLSETLPAVLRNLPTHVAQLARAMYFSGTLDVPVLAWLALVAVLAMRRDAWFLRAVFVVQLAPLFLMLASGSQLSARRYVIGQGYDLFVIACWVSELPRTSFLRGTVLAAALAGAGLQLHHLDRFTRTGIRERSVSLPFTESVGDFHVDPNLMQGVASLFAELDAGRTVVLLYGYGAYPENTTDPMGIPERLYLRLGHHRFVERVRIVGVIPCRYACVPAWSADELLAWLGGGTPSGGVVVVRYDDTLSPVFHAHEAEVWGRLEEAFELTLRAVQPAAVSGMRVYDLVGRRTPVGASPRDHVSVAELHENER